MDDVARLAARDRADLFSTAASLRGDMRAEVVEKDFWVCWTLKRIFTLQAPPAGLIFKGGTSLSKAYGAIARFSEDVDLSFDRAALGFGGEKDPGAAPSQNQTRKRLEDLSEVCRKMIRERFGPQLGETFTEFLGMHPSPATWQIDPDPDDPDGQTLLFHYPAGLARGERGALPYIRPVVRLEMGARGDQWPAEAKAIVPYAAEAVPKPFKDPRCPVRVLGAERTFWEKATVLHACCHCPEGRPWKERQSRHFYDVARLYEAGVGKKALADLELLRKVAEHQAVFFRSSWSRYEEAVPGTLRLVPPEHRRKELDEDYRKMGEMIFGEPPLERIVTVLGEIERGVNRRT
jgi:Nucleotidyl transferase AbiEii toxin, Type IV TA system